MTPAVSAGGLEHDVQLDAIGGPGPQIVLAHLARDRRALVLLQVHLEVGVRDPGLVEAERLAGLRDDGRDGGLLRHAHAR
eukprot:CAMPEP_0204599404 /NCGR_PEP_ID=MMETSP0661-20131031/54798_1 /ASSEMBLY_ACC=CAM_ASM_000606 /TAXON_ID=109239 /ORGANISM="Alexandrium margalefi, Strain AMGDE01CS-322" /LENGTH=79 /DNA_ID=CAMNT_0051610123 /DNA_START=62 /DNA_END=298 /DNA_ORIENTATION=+